MKYQAKQDFHYGDQYFKAGDYIPETTVYYLEMNLGKAWTQAHIEYITEVTKRED